MVNQQGMFERTMWSEQMACGIQAGVQKKLAVSIRMDLNLTHP